MIDDEVLIVMPAHEPLLPSGERDLRLYAPEPEGCEARVKQGWEQDYCFAKNPGQDHFHQLMNGEIYLQRGDEKYCLNCAVRLGYLTHDRLNWQHRTPPEPNGGL